MIFSQEKAKLEALALPDEQKAIFRDNYASMLDRLASLREHYRAAPLPHFDPQADIEEIAQMVSHLSAFSRIVVFGTGGSSLGGQALCALQSRAARELLFVDNFDPHSFAHLLKETDWASTGVLIISKSGNTPETCFQMASLLAYIADQGVEPAQNFIAITGEGDNTIRRLAGQYNINVYAHAEDIGGRFAGLTNVGLVPAALIGLDYEKIIAGARAQAQECLANEGEAIVERAALHVTHLRAGRGLSVMMSYADRLAEFGLWFRQLWAESLGKDATGLTPINSLGPVDQHSQLQLYIDGPDDKFFTIIYLDQRELGAQTGSILDGDLNNSWLGDIRLGDIVTAQSRATIDTLSAHNRPVCEICLSHLDEEMMGRLFMHFIIETVLVADLLGVNAFDQPAVEEAKILTQKYLSQ